MRVKWINMSEVTSDCLSLVCNIILVQEVDCVSKKKKKVKFLHLEAVNVT